MTQVPDTRVQVESENASLRQELDAARQALRLQTTRCRQVDAALSRRLKQKESEVRSWRSLREQQLSHVMRALMMLEAKLRREQRGIRSMLGERDSVIRAQQLEIARLKKLLDAEVRLEEVKPDELSRATTPTEFEYDLIGDVKPDLISSLGISHSKRSQDNLSTPTTTDNEDSQSNLDSLQLSFYEVGSQPESLMSDLSTQSCNGESEPLESRLSPPEQRWIELQTNSCYHVDTKSSRCQDLVNSLKKLEVKVHVDSAYPSQKNILSPVKEESSLSLFSGCNSPSRCNPGEETLASCDLNYQDCKPSPSALLQEVRISGRNEYEDNPVLNCVNQILLRDQEEFLEEQRALRLEKSKKDAEVLNNKKLTKSTENLSLLNEQIIVQHSTVKKVYPPLETVTDTIGQLTSPNKRNLPKESFKVKSIPPALPPKPQRLLLNKPLDQKTIINSIIPQLKSGEVSALDVIKKRASLPNPSSDNELYVISNSAIDDELLHQLQGRRIQSCSELPVSLNKSKPLAPPRERVLSHPTHKPSGGPQAQKDKSADQKSPSSKDDEAIRNSPAKKMASTSNSCIKVASPVSSLLNSVDAVEPTADDGSGKKTTPSVSQIVRRFEDLGTKTVKEVEVDNSNSLQKNFEEFRLDECDMDTLCGDGRPEGDGSAAVLEARISYENFLEATGLSQKSIMTPSRLFSNHKSVMKPKDVKHRSRVKAAAVVDRCNINSATPSGSIVRYWTEPFL